MPTCVTINGEIVEGDHARVSVFDHGFLYGDSVYESFRTYRQRPILVDRNFRRLEHAAGAIGLQLPWDAAQLETEVFRAIDHANNPEESLVRIIVTRGEGAMSPDPFSCTRPNVVIIVLPLDPPSDQMYEQGIAVTFSTLKRDTHIASIKTGNLIHQVLGAQEARARGAVEAIFLTADGFVSDGTRSNIYFGIGDEILTPSAGSGIVAGITRSLVLELAKEHGVRIREAQFTPDQVRDADEAFITSTTRGILPVTRLDDRMVGNGTIGPMTRALMDAFDIAVDRLAGGSP
jgi:branched-chain amino acid aminotransferase